MGGDSQPRKAPPQEDGYEMGSQGEDRLDVPAEGHVQQGCPDDRSRDGEQEGESQRHRLGHSDDPVFHQSRRARSLRDPAARARESEEDPASKEGYKSEAREITRRRRGPFVDQGISVS